MFQVNRRLWKSGEEHKLWGQTTQVQILALSPISCVTWSCYLTFLCLSFFICKIGM